MAPTEEWALEWLCSRCNSQLLISESDIHWHHSFGRFFFFTCDNCGSDIIIPNKMIPPEIRKRITKFSD